MAVPSTDGKDPITVAKACYLAYASGDRAAIEKLIAPDFRFTSPLDNRLDRETYFERCWPNSEFITGFRFVRLARDGDAVFVTYEGRGSGDKVFRNTEVLTIRNGLIVEAEVYFGWNLPHEAPEGGFVEPPASAA